MNMYLVQYHDGYETYWADNYEHAVEQAKDAHYTSPEAIFLCTELNKEGEPIMQGTVRSVNNPNASWNNPK